MDSNLDKYGGVKYRGPIHKRTRSIWMGIRNRCHNPNPNRNDCRFYWARGIRLCERWLSYGNFLVDMGECPPGYQIDRINSLKGYQPDNCRWVKSQAGGHKRNLIMIEYQGISLNVWQWSLKLGICLRKIYRRHVVGYPVEIVLSLIPTRVVPKIPGVRWSGFKLVPA